MGEIGLWAPVVIAAGGLLADFFWFAGEHALGFGEHCSHGATSEPRRTTRSSALAAPGDLRSLALV